MKKVVLNKPEDFILQGDLTGTEALFVYKQSELVGMIVRTKSKYYAFITSFNEADWGPYAYLSDLIKVLNSAEFEVYSH